METRSLYRRFAAVLPAGVVPLQAAAETEIPSLASNFGQMLFGLAIVVALLMVCLWVLKRLSVPRGAASGLKLLGGIGVGTRERVVLLEVGDKVLVLGVTATNINTLHVLDSEEVAQPDTPPGLPAQQGDFAAWLKKSLNKAQGR